MTTIITKNSSTASAVPVSGDLTQGELAVNVTDKKLYTKDSGGSVVKIVGSLGNQEASSVTLSGGSINGTTVGAVTPSTGAFTTLSASSTVSGTGFSTYLASPPAIGGTAAAAGSFTTLSASSTVTLSGGTANGVLYLNGSKVATSGSALTFDGTTFATTGTFTSAGASNSGNLNFTGTGNRITGDFSNATETNRVAFQTSTANDSTVVGLLPNGTSVTSAIRIYNNSNPTNASIGQLVTAGGTEIRLVSGITGTGTYLPMTFYTGGSERMRIDSSGNVGIGTSSPATKLNVIGDVQLSRSATASDAAINFGSNTNNYIYSGNSSNLMAFATNGAERMRIDSSGNLLVGTTSGGTTNSDSITLQPANKSMYINHITGTTTGYGYINFGYGATYIGGITQNGTTAVAYNTSSDYRLKENIAPMTGALAKVAALNPVTYNWKVDGSAGQGFIAHELQAVVPDCVTGEKDAVDAEGNPQYQGIDTSFLVATLTAAIKEQQAIIEQQSQAIASLTTRIAALEAK